MKLENSNECIGTGSGSVAHITSFLVAYTVKYNEEAARGYTFLKYPYYLKMCYNVVMISH